MSHVSHESFSAKPDDKAGALTRSDGTDVQPRLLIVVEQRALFRGLLNTWIGDLGQGAEVISVADAETALRPDALARAAMVIVGVRAGMLSDAWLDRQVAWLRAHRADVPVVAIMEADDMHAIEGALNLLPLQGYIPTTSSMDLAAAALQLVAAGGVYLPPNRGEDRPPEQASLGPMQQPSPSPIARLTPRERAVLDLLEQGMPNKIIAYRLGMSQSTVKAHVHSIISKLNVRNRTEAAVTSYRPARLTETEVRTCAAPADAPSDVMLSAAESTSASSNSVPLSPVTGAAAACRRSASPPKGRSPAPCSNIVAMDRFERDGSAQVKRGATQPLPQAPVPMPVRPKLSHGEA